MDSTQINLTAETRLRLEILDKISATPWTNPTKMEQIRAESRRRLAVETLYPYLHVITTSMDSMAHSVPGNSDSETEWLCSPWRRMLWGQYPGGDLVFAPSPSETDPMLQISDADPNSDDPVYDLD
jgi:hypothetical protein